MNIQVINYDKSYSKKIPELFTNTIHNVCINDYTKEQLEAWATPIITYNAWENRLNKTKPFLAIDGKKLIGFTEFYDDYIDCFYVDEKYQGMGVGRALLEHIINLAKNKKIKQIKVDASITAKPFFEKFGFKEVRKNRVKRNNQELVNFSLTLDL